MLSFNRTLPLLSLLIAFGVYLLTLTHSVSFFDSGELISGASTLGISHPPGYPLYVQIGHLFSNIPIGNKAFRVNLMSAFFGALSVMVLFSISRHLLIRIFSEKFGNLLLQLAALFTSLIFAFSLNQWSQTNMSEVYSMNTFFIALIIWILLHWRGMVLGEDETTPHPDTRLIYFCAFLFGMGFGNHHTILVVVPVAFVIIVLTRWQLYLKVRPLSITLFSFILGLSIYLYMPLRATTPLIMNWGDPETLKQFLWMFLRQGYPQATMDRSWDLFLIQLKTVNLLYEFSLAGFILGIIGLARFFIKEWVNVAVSLIVFFVLSIGLIIWGNPIKENVFLIEAFHTPTYMIFAPWIGVGVLWLFSLAATGLNKVIESKPVQNQIIFWTALVGLSIVPAFLLSSHYAKNDRSRNFISFDYAVNELKSLTSNAILFTWGDSGAFPLWYLQYVEKYQPGVLLLHTPHLGSDWYVNEIPDLKRSRIRTIPMARRAPGLVVEIIAMENMGSRRSYIDYSSKYSYPIKNLEFAPHGIVYKHKDKGEHLDLPLWGKYVTRELISNKIVKDLDIGKAISIYGFCYYDNGVRLLKEGKINEGKQMLSNAVKVVPGLRNRVQKALYQASRAN